MIDDVTISHPIQTHGSKSNRAVEFIQQIDDQTLPLQGYHKQHGYGLDVKSHSPP